MKVKYHPSTELLTAYAAGSLPLSQALCLAAHIEMCQHCKQNYKRLKSLGGYMFGMSNAEQEVKSAQQTVSHNSLRQRVFDLIGGETTEEYLAPQAVAATAGQGPGIITPRTSKNASNVPKCLRQFVPTSYEALSWKRVSPSIKQATLCSDVNGAQVALLRIKPGGSSGHHTHMGDEYTTVLKGAFSDETGIFQEGDFVVRDNRHRHRPIATKDSECICLTVVEAPIQFTGFFSRWLNPLMRLVHPTYQMQR